MPSKGILDQFIRILTNKIRLPEWKGVFIRDQSALINLEYCVFFSG